MSGSISGWLQHAAYGYQKAVDQFLADVVHIKPQDVTVPDRAAAVLTLLASPLACSIPIKYNTYRPLPTLTVKDNPISTGKVQQALSSILGKYECDKLSVDREKITCTKNYTKCVDSSLEAVASCWDETHRSRGTRESEGGEISTSRECGVREERVCHRSESGSNTKWEIVKKGCLGVYAKIAERDGKPTFPSSVVVEQQSLPPTTLGLLDYTEAHQIADVLSAYCNATDLL